MIFKNIPALQDNTDVKDWCLNGPVKRQRKVASIIL